MNKPETISELSGLEALRRRLAEPTVDGLPAMLGMRLVEVTEGKCTFEATPSDKFYNPTNRVHGGYAATLIDTAMGTAVYSKVAASVALGTIDISVKYVGKIVAESGPLRCIGTVLHAGRTMFTAEARVFDKAGKLCAHGTGTFLVYPS